MQFLADCLHDLTALGPGGVLAMAGALFLAGLAGGFTHCAGMCAPFVLAQAGQGAGGPMLARLAGAALLPYHAGRMLGYGLLGALAGAGAGLVSGITGLRWLLAALLAVAALLMFAEAARRAGLRLPHAPKPAMPGMVRRLLDRPRGGFTLGLLLSALPCGMLYGALAGAAASGSALGGFIGMAAFAAGTAPGLMGVALLGGFFSRAMGPWARRLAMGLFALNGAVLGGMAWRMLA
ncbi:sulfite exporter TauE/SafE family protein [Rhodovarius crocodyli]|uniref:Sulfite exporter TauE/SafE family protein n=1 Tax=Rhodovarius crocodyli TaxID=1979269 RepID=A0A437MEM2_9PROT|nr:sulfite exporter TauE/SafE family protein [Rhodovarius crocodyli]RVT96094.1 sulfite exporter TauE/SafE family protein [Rhodovarius crocodyli]